MTTFRSHCKICGKPLGVFDTDVCDGCERAEKELQKVITHLTVAYSEALKKDYVQKPMAYALYEVWKVWDEKYGK